MATGQTFTLQEINLFTQDNFVHALSSLFEGPPWIVVATCSARPFLSLDHLYQALCTVMYTAPLTQKIALIQSHPDLVGRAAQAGTLTPASTNEQASAGLDRLTPAEIATFTRLNEQYRERYGFPFVICARENKKESMLAGFEARLQHTREEEIEVALAEIAKICALRLRDLIRPEQF